MKNSNLKKIVLLLITSLVLTIGILVLSKSVVNVYFNEGNRLASRLVRIWYSLKSNESIFLVYIIFFIFSIAITFGLYRIIYIIRNRKLRISNRVAFIAIIKPFIYTITSILIVNVFISLFNTIIDFYCNSSNGLLLNIIEIYYLFYDYYIIDVIGYIFVFILYLNLMEKKRIRLSKLIYSTEKMVSNNMEIAYIDEKNDDIGIISRNINSVVEKLNSIAKEERNAQKTKNDLITNVSHDLRTPLTSIIGYLSLVDNDKYNDEVKLRYYISIAHDKAKSLNILINDLFELTKMQNNSEKLEIVEIDLIELISQLISQFQYLFKVNNIDNRIEFCDEKITIKGDGNKLVRVFENLLSNAIKYGKDGKYIDVIVKKENNRAVVEVSNYGEEINSYELPHIFDRFYRIDKSRNSEISGSGLGLAIAKSIVELHNGRISAYSNYGKTTFKVEFNLE